ncbi:MAG: cupin domain-containing protein [Terriglobia bacterium]
MTKRSFSALLSLVLSLGVLGLTQIGNAQHHGSGTRNETLLLLVADGPLAMEPASEMPSIDLAGKELILNSALVPKAQHPTGLLLQTLHVDAETGRMFTIGTFPADVVLPRHYHPVTERVMMLGGTAASPETQLREGLYWEAPPEVAMRPFRSEAGATFVLLSDGPFELIWLEEGEDAPNLAGKTFTVDPEGIEWKRLSELMPGSVAQGVAKRLTTEEATGGGVYLVKLTRPTEGRLAVCSANLEGYVLQGELKLSDPYHGTHVLGPGLYFRIPAGFPSDLFGLAE